MEIRVSLLVLNAAIKDKGGTENVPKWFGGTGDLYVGEVGLWTPPLNKLRLKKGTLGAGVEVSNSRIAFLSCQSPYHEIPDGPVEDCPVIVAFFTQTDEILSSFGNLEKRSYRECDKLK